MDRFSSKNPFNEPLTKPFFPAQPLKLKESLRIRDGLGGGGTDLVSRSILEIIRKKNSAWGFPWVCDN